MLDLATRKIGDRWFIEFAESLTPVHSLEDIRWDETGTILDSGSHSPCGLTVKPGQIVIQFKSGAWAIRTPVKPKSDQ